MTINTNSDVQELNAFDAYCRAGLYNAGFDAAQDGTVWEEATDEFYWQGVRDGQLHRYRKYPKVSEDTEEGIE